MNNRSRYIVYMMFRAKVFVQVLTIQPPIMIKICGEITEVFETANSKWIPDGRHTNRPTCGRSSKCNRRSLHRWCNDRKYALADAYYRICKRSEYLTRQHEIHAVGNTSRIRSRFSGCAIKRNEKIDEWMQKTNLKTWVAELSSYQFIVVGRRKCWWFALGYLSWFDFNTFLVELC